jgi:N-acetylmuramoyl-L-alanine amidase
MNIISYPSPNFNERAFGNPDMIIIHYTGMKTANQALERMSDNNQPRVSAHFFINMQGDIYQLVDMQKRAWHAGVSNWEGITDINSRSIGIELENKGHEWGYHAFPKLQIKALIKLLDKIRNQYIIQDKHIIGHSDIAPLRKKDPGYLFPWHILAQYGHGIAPFILKKTIYHKNRMKFIENLSDFGYQCDNVCFLSPLNRKVIETFCNKVTWYLYKNISLKND